jgi:hypothetical protein
MAGMGELGALALEKLGVDPKWAPVYASSAGGLFAGIEGYAKPSKNELGINDTGTPPLIGGARCVVNTNVRFAASKAFRSEDDA